jgi:hypothetical protein
MPDETSTRTTLIEEFEEDEDQCFDAGRQNNITDIVLSVISVLGSLAATVLVSTNARKALIASIAAVPAACTSLQRIVDFRGRSAWYFQHAAALKALSVSLRYTASPNLEDFAERRADLEIEGEQRWEQILGGKDSAARRAKRKSHRQ